MRKYAMFALIAFLPPLLSAARLTLRDGSVINGQFISGSSNELIFQDDNGVRRRFNLNQVRGLDFDNINTPLTDRRDSTYSDQRGGIVDRGADRNTADRSDRRDSRDWTVLPVGTSISVRTDEGIDGQNAAEGRTFQASIVQDVLDSTGKVVVPRGSPATLIVRRMSEGGTLTSGGYVLDLESVR